MFLFEKVSVIIFVCQVTHTKEHMQNKKRCRFLKEYTIENMVDKKLIG